jgi:hypothetical protein
MITFIIPTIGRSSLPTTLLSLINQTSDDWQALIIFDGINIRDFDDIFSIFPKDLTDKFNHLKNKFHIIKTPEKMGENSNNAGKVRNYGIEIILKGEILNNSNWIAFLDDDDTINKKYVEYFFNELNQNLNDIFDVLIYRMNKLGKIIPSINSKDFIIGDVGISFIINKSIFKTGIKFVSSGIEDFLLLNQIRKLNYKIIISPYVFYYVNNSIHNEEIKGEKRYINYNNNINTLISLTILNTLLLEK